MSVAFKQNEAEIFFPQQTGEEKKSLLRFITCGSVDDGKSTLIGRLLHDTGHVFDDQREDLVRDSKKFGTSGDELDFALLVDGLSAEREQGITIDVAYRYFSSPQRAFIIADTPGHEQYTRNMATGASQADLAIILIDARKGLLPQTRRHSFITSLVGIRNVIVAINKMDLVGFDERIFQRIEREYRSLLPRLAFEDVRFIPISAKLGTNVATSSKQMPWYNGPTLLAALEEAPLPDMNRQDAPFQLPVQWVNRPNLDFRGYCGTIASGHVTVGDEIISLPSGQSSRIKQIYTPAGACRQASHHEAVTVTFEDDIDTSRGDVIVAADHILQPSRAIRADILWMAAKPLRKGKRLLVKLATMERAATIAQLEEKVDIHSYAAAPTENLDMNEIGQVLLAFEQDLVALPYHQSRDLGAFILIDMQSHETLALGVVRAALPHLPSHQEPRQSVSRLAYFSNIWLGRHGRHMRRVVALRLFSSTLLAALAWNFGAHLAGAAIIFAADFGLRPFLRLLLPQGKMSDADNWQDGAGI